MAKYYYNKYTSATGYSVSSFTSHPNGSGAANGYLSYSINQSTGEFIFSGEMVHVDDYSGYVYRYGTSSKQLRRLQKIAGTYDSYYIWTATSELYYMRGSLVQSNIIAENGTYPADGRYSDGYWYVRGSIYYDPPTVPSSISIPSIIKGGESFTVSWGSSSYQTGYRLERQLNGGSWVQIVQQVGRSYVDTVVKGTNTVNYRVMAYGSGGNSGYRTGTTRSVINFPEIFENYNGTFIAYEGAWENVGGAWVEIDSVWENVNGVWIEL